MAGKRVNIVVWRTLEAFPTVRNQAVCFRKRGWQVIVHCLGTDRPVGTVWEDGGIEVMPHGLAGTPGQMVATLRRMARSFGDTLPSSDLVVLHTFQSFGVFSLVRFARITCPIAYFAYEFYPWREVTGLQRLPKLLECRYAKHCLVVVTDPLRAPLHHWELGLGRCPVVFRNCPPLESSLPLPERTELRRLGYCGAISSRNGMDTIARAVTQADRNVVLKMVGPIDPAFQDRFKRLVAENPGRFVYGGVVPYREIAPFLSQCDAGIVYYDWQSLNTAYCAPRKLYEYLAQGLPVLASPLPGLQATVAEQRLGWLFADNTADGIARTIEYASDEPDFASYSRRCAEMHRKCYNYESQFDRFVQHLGL